MTAIMIKISRVAGMMILIVLIPALAEAQNSLLPQNNAQNKDTFMFWAGHKEKGKFIASNGAIITVDPKTGDPEINFPKGKDPLQPVIDENNRTAEAEKELQEADSKDPNGIKIYPIVAKAIELYEKLKEETNNIVLKDIDWGDEENPATRFFGPEGFKNFLTGECQRIKPIYDDIMAYAKKVQDDKNPDIPIPPAADYFNCWGCDKKKRDNYDTLVKHYVNDFFKEETKRVKNILSLMRELSLVFGKNAGLSEEDKGATWDAIMENAIEEAMGGKNHPTFCSYLNEAPYKLRDALQTIILYASKRAGMLAKKYLNAHYELQIQPVIRVCLNISRQVSLLGMVSNEDYYLRECGAACKTLYEDWLQKKKDAHDYTRFADLPYIISYLREAILLGAHDDADPDKGLVKLMNDDQFRITIDVETSVGHAPVFQIMKFHCDGYLIAVTDDDSDGCLKWVPASAKGDKNMLIYTQLRQAEVTGPTPHLEYIGTHDYYTNLMLKARFCQDEAHDTLFIKSALQPDPGDGNKWTIAGKTTYGGAFESMSGFQLFIDPMKAGMEMAKEAQSGELQKNMQEKVMANAQQAIDNAKKFQQMQQSNMSPGDMQLMLNKAFESANAANNGLNFLSTNTLRLPIDVSNKSPVLIDQIFDANNFNPTAAQQGMIKVGTIHVKLEYSPRQ